MVEVTTTAEVWKPCDGFEGFVSNLGSLKKPSGRLVKHRADKDGYRIGELKRDGRWVTIKVHRIVAIAFIGRPTDSRNQINHKNGDKADNRVENLEWASVSENLTHKCRVLKKCSGENQYQAKFTDAAVADIRLRFNKKEIGVDEIVAEHCISVATARRLVAGESYLSAAGPVSAGASHYRKIPGRTSQNEMTPEKLAIVVQGLREKNSLASIAFEAKCSRKTVANIRDKKVKYAKHISV